MLGGSFSDHQDTPVGPSLGHKISKMSSSGGSLVVLLVPGAPSDVHQGNALERVPARGIAKAARRIVPDGFSCSTCAHLGRFARSFLHSASPQQALSQPSASPQPALSKPSASPQQALSKRTFEDFCIFLDPSGGARSFCSTRSTFGQKIFLAQTNMSSNSPAPEVYQKIFCWMFWSC